MNQSTATVLFKKMKRGALGLCIFSAALIGAEGEKACSPCEEDTKKTSKGKVCAPRFEGLTTFIPRSQGDNTARELVGWQRQLFICYENNYAAIASAVEYTRSFDTECIAKHLFTTNCLTFSGSQFNTKCEPGKGTTSTRNPRDIVADYFGLPTDFTGTLAIKPLIENAIIDINLYFGLQDSGPGLFLWINAPIVHTRWTLGLDDCIACKEKFRGCTEFPRCYMYSGPNTPILDSECPNPDVSPRTPPVCPANSHLDVPRFLRNSKCTTQSIREALSGDFTFGDMTEPWEFGRFSFCPRSKTGLADIDVMMGWNIIQNDYAHFGFFGVTVIPTGNRPKARYIFEPMVGDGKHWKLGGGASAHLSIFPDDCWFNMGLYAYGRAVHVFDTDQIRSFDFRRDEGEPTHILTRYMLLKEFNTAKEYNGTMINAINFATRNCEVKVGLLADVSVKAFIAANGWEFDLGYNFYFREREKVCIKTECPCPIDSRLFGIKGLEGVCCTSYQVANSDGNNIVRATEQSSTQPLNATQPEATMFDPQLPNNEAKVTITNPVVCFSWNSNIPAKDTPISQLTPKNCYVVPSSTEPKLVTCADLDPRSAAQGEMRTNKVFGHLSYTFDSCYTPFVGIGAEGEFDACNNNALQQWGIWIKAGASF